MGWSMLLTPLTRRGSQNLKELLVSMLCFTCLGISWCFVAQFPHYCRVCSCVLEGSWVASWWHICCAFMLFCWNLSSCLWHRTHFCCLKWPWIYFCAYANYFGIFIPYSLLITLLILSSMLVDQNNVWSLIWKKLCEENRPERLYQMKL